MIGLVILGSVVGPQMFGGENGGDLAQACSTANPRPARTARVPQHALRQLDPKLLAARVSADLRQAVDDATDTVFFAQAVSTGCGTADSGVGPFFCPIDRQIYIDLSFYDEFANRFGAEGEFAQPYVLAHEYGHHLEDLLGTSSDVRRQQERDPRNANELSVRLEHQADCYAGVTAHHAAGTTDVKGLPIFMNLTQADIDQALKAAAAIGDDTIQRGSGTGVDESKIAHGTAEQRQRWFKTGYDSGDAKRCNTFTSHTL